MLLGRSETATYHLRVDSLMAEAYREESMHLWANTEQELDAPYNSMDSKDDYQLYRSDSGDEDPFAPESPLKGKTAKDSKWFDERILDVSPFRMESMKYFPFRTREGEMPIKLLKI